MHDSGSSSNPLVELGYEHRDVQLRPLVIALLGLVGLIVVSILGILWFYDFTAPRYAQDKGKPRWETERKLPPHPQLQSFPKDEMSMYLKAEDPYRASLSKAVADSAAKGISGIDDSDVAPAMESKGYPGSGDFDGSGSENKSGAPTEGAGSH